MRLGSSLRSRTAGATVRAASALCGALGISRVTNITRLDRLGVPVYTSVRPRGRVLRVHAGKGVRDVEARAGALMEALEFAVAEAAALATPNETVSVAEWTAQFGGTLRLVDFAPRLGQRIDPADRLPVVRCEILDSGASALLPRELVLLEPAPPAGPPLFGVTTNGLASGNSVAEATLHALLEVLERDATTLQAARDESAWVDPGALPAPFGRWAGAWARLGVELIVRQLPNAFGLPCYGAYLHEAASSDVNLAHGSGLHLDARIALARAVCEAAQSRLSFIHGGRDDIGYFYAQRIEAGAEAWQQAQAARLETARDQRRVAPAPAADTGSPVRPEPALQQVLARLAERGFGPVFRYVFPSPGQGLQVVRVVVARCESFSSGGGRMGPRLLALATGRA
jgi:ribosomal protein S12 methylthiotransferase accessory factor